MKETWEPLIEFKLMATARLLKSK